MVFHTTPCKSENFKLSLNISLTHLRAQRAFYELKGDLSPVMLKEIFHDSLKISRFTRICMENHSSVTGWQELFLSYKYGWKFTGYPILICSFSSSNKFFQKQTAFTFTESWSRDQLIQKACSDPQLFTDSITQSITLDTRGFFSRVTGCFVVGRTKTKELKPITNKKELKYNFHTILSRSASVSSSLTSVGRVWISTDRQDDFWEIHWWKQ